MSVCRQRQARRELNGCAWRKACEKPNVDNLGLKASVPDLADLSQRDKLAKEIVEELEVGPSNVREVLEALPWD